MDRLEEILAANKAFVAHGKHDYTEEDIAASKLPKKKMAIFTCMDTRLTEILEPAMGIQRGDAKIIRTIGNYLTGEFDAVIRSLMVAIYELGVEEIFVVGHYECGMAKTTADSLAAAMRAHGVSECAIAKIHGELEVWANAFRDPVENVKDAVAKITSNPYNSEEHQSTRPDDPSSDREARCHSGCIRQSQFEDDGRLTILFHKVYRHKKGGRKSVLLFVRALSLANPFSKKESGLRFFTEMMVLRFFHEQCYDEKAEFKCYDDDVERGHVTEGRRQEAHERAGEKREEIT